MKKKEKPNKKEFLANLKGPMPGKSNPFMPDVPMAKKPRKKAPKKKV